jgi:tetratricopeptide (TPR) repeat protein
MSQYLSAFLLLAIGATAFPAPLWQDNNELARLVQEYRGRPTDWKLCNQIAIAYTQAQQFDTAAEFYGKVLSLNPAFVPARKNLAVVLWFANRKGEAEKIFRALLPVIPGDVVPHLYLGLAHYERRQFAEAKLHFSQAGDLALENPEVLPAVVESYLSLKDETILPHAIRFIERTADSGAATKVAEVLNRHGQYQATVRILESRPSLDVDGYALIAEAWDKQKQPERAFAILAKAIDANPENEQGYAALAAFASAHQNDAYALKTIEQGLTRNPRWAVLLLQRGLLIALGGDRGAAKASLRAASEAKPEWSLPVLAMGIVELEAGRTEQAAEAFQRAIGLAPNETHGYYFCALALGRIGETGRAKALAMLRKALTIAPDDNRCRVLLAQQLIAEGHLQEGVAQLERAIRLDKKNTSALYQLALAYRKLGRTALSEKYMAEFVALKGKDKEDQTALVQIMKIIK